MKYLLCLLGIIVFIVLLQISRIILMTRIPYDHKPFQRIILDSKLKILIIGDSTAVGTGAIDSTESVAGWFGQDFPIAHIENYSQNGKRIREQVNKFPTPLLKRYNLVVIQIGGNDIMKFTNSQNVEKDLSNLISQAKSISDHVVILHSGNVGLAPIFIWPFNQIFTERSKAIRNIYITKAHELDVYYVDLYQERAEDFFLKNIPKYYSPDKLHPSGEGYHWWYQNIRQTLKQNNIQFNSG